MTEVETQRTQIKEILHNALQELTVHGKWPNRLLKNTWFIEHVADTLCCINLNRMLHLVLENLLINVNAQRLEQGLPAHPFEGSVAPLVMDFLSPRKTVSVLGYSISCIYKITQTLSASDTLMRVPLVCCTLIILLPLYPNSVPTNASGYCITLCTVPSPVYKQPCVQEMKRRNERCGRTH